MFHWFSGDTILEIEPGHEPGVVVVALKRKNGEMKSNRSHKTEVKAGDKPLLRWLNKEKSGHSRGIRGYRMDGIVPFFLVVHTHRAA